MAFGILLDASPEVERDMRLIASDLGVDWVRYDAPDTAERRLVDRADFLLLTYLGETTVDFIRSCNAWGRRLPICVYGLPDWESTISVANAGACMVYRGAPPACFLRDLLGRVNPPSEGGDRSPSTSRKALATYPDSISKTQAQGEHWRVEEARRRAHFADLDRALCLAQGSVLVYDEALATPLAEIELYARSWGLVHKTISSSAFLAEAPNGNDDAETLWIIPDVGQRSLSQNQQLAERMRTHFAKRDRGASLVLPVRSSLSIGNVAPSNVRAAFASFFAVANWTTP